MLAVLVKLVSAPTEKRERNYRQNKRRGDLGHSDKESPSAH